MKFFTSIQLFFYLIFPLILFGQGDAIFNDSIVHEIRVTFDNQNFWTDLTSDYNDNYPDVPYRMASVVIDGELIDSVGIRQKGFASHFGAPESDKKSLKIDFNHFVGGKKYDGLKKINMNNGFGDPALQRDKLCYDILNNSGVNAPRTSYAKVFLNDQYWGVYVLVEQIDRTFLKSNFSNSAGNLFKNIGNSELDWLGSNPSAYQEIFELKTDLKPGAWEDFVNLMSVINQSSDAEFSSAIKEVFNVDLYLKVLAVDVATGNWDSYIEHGRNFYLYQDSSSGKFNWIPWDYNFALGGNFPPFVNDTITDPENCETIINGSCPYPATDSIFLQVIAQDNFCCNSDWDNVCQEIYDGLSDTTVVTSGANINTFPLSMASSEKVLIKRLLNVPEFQERYYREFCSLLETNFTSERINPLIARFGDLIRNDLQTDSNYFFSLEDFEADLLDGNAGIPGLKLFFEVRSTSLNNEISVLYDCENVNSNLNPLDISINEFMASNDSLSGLSDNDDEYDDWIELYNNTSNTIDLSNAYLTDDFAKPMKWNFPVGTSIPSNGFLIVWADNDETQQGLHCNFKLNKSGDFIMLSDQNLVLDSLSFGEQTKNKTLARIPNGTGVFEIKDHTFNGNNDLTSSIIDFAENEVSIFPNPTKDKFYINFENIPESTYKLQLFNGLGELILTQLTNEKSNNITIPEAIPGMYFMVLSNLENNFVRTEKINIIGK